MIIHQPEIKIEGKEIIVSSRIETKANIPIPENLWFKFPVQYKDSITDRVEGFFVSLIMLGMYLNENIEIRGDVSPKLVSGIDLFCTKYQKKYPSILNKIDFNFKNINPGNPNLTREIRLAPFSGGADSFYTFWSHFHPDESEHPSKLTHGIFMQGLDILLKDKEYYQYYLNDYQNLFNRWGLSLISGSTNGYEFNQFRIPWAFSITTALIGSTMALGKQVSKFYKPGIYEPNPKNPQNPGSFSHLLSTETFKVTVQGGNIDRTQKLIRMLEWPDVQKHFRTCLNLDRKIGVNSCNRCRKCLSASLFISLYDKQEFFPNFNKKFKLKEFILLCYLSYGLKTDIQKGYLNIFKEKRRYDLILFFLIMMPINAFKNFFSNKIIPLFPKNLIYSVKKIVYKRNTSP